MIVTSLSASSSVLDRSSRGMLLSRDESYGPVTETRSRWDQGLVDMCIGEKRLVDHSERLLNIAVTDRSQDIDYSP